MFRKISMPIMYKLVSQDYKTRNDTSWEVGKTNRASGPGSSLCSSGVLHCYASPEQAVFFNPVHANIKNPILLEIECSEILVDDGLKYGCKEQTPIRELPLPVFSKEQLIEFGIRCALLVCEEKKFVEWAERWLSGEDRTQKSATAVAAYHRRLAARMRFNGGAVAVAAYHAVAVAAYHAVDGYAAYAADAAASNVKNFKEKVKKIIKKL